MVPRKLAFLLLVAAIVLSASLAGAEMKRTASGKPDMSGFYDASTLTPLNRPEHFGDRQFMTREEADKLTATAAAAREKANAASDPSRGCTRPNTWVDAINSTP